MKALRAGACAVAVLLAFPPGARAATCSCAAVPLLGSMDTGAPTGGSWLPDRRLRVSRDRRPLQRFGRGLRRDGSATLQPRAGAAGKPRLRRTVLRDGPADRGRARAAGRRPDDDGTRPRGRPRDAEVFADAHHPLPAHRPDARHRRRDSRGRGRRERLRHARRGHAAVYRCVGPRRLGPRGARLEPGREHAQLRFRQLSRQRGRTTATTGSGTPGRHRWVPRTAPRGAGGLASSCATARRTATSGRPRAFRTREDAGWTACPRCSSSSPNGSPARSPVASPCGAT